MANTIIMINGGLGRIITSIPALLKYHKKNKNKEWYVMIPGWDFILWGFPELQPRSFNPELQRSFELFLDSEEVICPEPYKVPSYYKNKISLREAFDIEINNSLDHSDLPEMQLKLSISEKRSAYEMIEYVKKEQKKKKTIVIQPYGSTANPHPYGIYDDSLRSIPEPMLTYFIDNLSKDYNLIFMGAKELHTNNKTYKPDPDPNLREWAAIISSADYFIGCDSCGQHMAKALNKNASVVIAGTHRNNVTYDNFHIIERDVPFYPDAMRISGLQSQLSSRLNEQRIEFTEEEIKKSYEEILKRIENSNNDRNSIKNDKIILEKNKKIKYF